MIALAKSYLSCATLRTSERKGIFNKMTYYSNDLQILMDEFSQCYNFRFESLPLHIPEMPVVFSISQKTH